MSIVRFHTFDGMLQTRTSRFLRPINELTRSINVNANQIGSLTKRIGYGRYSAVIDSGTDVNGAHRYTRQSGSTDRLLAVAGAGNTLYYENGAGSWVSIGTLLAGAKQEMATFIDEVFIVGYNSSAGTYDTTRNLDGLTLTTNNNLGSAPNARFVKVFRQRLALINLSTNSSAFRYSSVPTSGAITWPSTNIEEVRTEDGEELVGVGELANRMVLFKNNSMHEWNETSIIQVAKVGTTSHRSIIEHESFLFFFSNSQNKKGFYVYSGGRPKLISGKIQEWIDGISDSTLSDIVGWRNGDNLIWYVGTITLTSEIGTETFTNSGIVYNLPTNTWTVYQFADQFTVAANFEVSGTIRPYLGTANGDVQQMAIAGDSVFDDDGTEISVVFRTTKLDLGSPEDIKRVAKAKFFTQHGQGMQIRVRADGGNWESLIQLTEEIQESEMNTKGHYFEFEGIESSTNYPLTFEGFSLDAEIDESFT